VSIFTKTAARRADGLPGAQTLDWSDTVIAGTIVAFGLLGALVASSQWRIITASGGHSRR
jgi:hypothetical protein